MMPQFPCASCQCPSSCRAARLRNARLCELADPSHADHDPGYSELVCRETPPAAGPPAPPSLPAMARDFAAALARWTAAGCPEVDDAEQARRLAICRAPCVPYYDPSRDACLKCGCGTVPVAVALGFDLAKKARWATEHCPIGMW